MVAAAVAGGVAYWVAGSKRDDETDTTTAQGTSSPPLSDPARADVVASDGSEAALVSDPSHGSTAAVGGSGDASDEGGDDDAAVAGQAVAAPAPRAAAGLSRGEIDAAFDEARVKLMACRGPIFGGKSGDRVRVQLTVRGRDGKVVGARPTGAHAKTKLGGCVAAELRKLEFPPFERAKHRFSRTVRL